MPLVRTVHIFKLQPTFSKPRDINAYSKAKASLEPLNVFRGHTSVVGVRNVVSFVLPVLKV